MLFSKHCVGHVGTDVKDIIKRRVKITFQRGNLIPLLLVTRRRDF